MTILTPRLVPLAVFTVGQEEYAVDLMRVREIMHLPLMTPLPKTLPNIDGIINVRGAALPLIDLRRCLNLPLFQGAYTRKVLIVTEQDRLIGLIVDRVVDVVRVPKDSLQQLPLSRYQDFQFLCLGLFYLQQRSIFLFDVHALFPKKLNRYSKQSDLTTK